MNEPVLVTAAAAQWPLPLTDAYVLTSGYQSWSEAEWRPLRDRQARPLLAPLVAQGHDPAFPPSGEAGVWRSHTLIALADPAGRGWVGCALGGRTSFTHWEAREAPGGVTLRLSCEGEPEPVTLVPTDDVLGTVEQLARRLGEGMNARTPPPPRVWCSWYSYYTDVTRADLLDNARAARALDLPFDVIQLDDGFEADIGDWLDVKPDFGGRIDDLPAELDALGFRAGLWLAPFIARPTSRLYQEHPDWFVRDDAGAPLVAGDNWGGAYHALDLSREDVLDWLEHLARTVTGWGYTYLKLDFLFAGAIPGKRTHDMTRANAYRAGLEAIRRGAEGAFLLGCGAPLAASVGLVDGMRVGPDVTPYWDNEARRVYLQDGTGPSLRGALHTCLNRWYQRWWFTPDPDVALLRRSQTLLTAAERTAAVALADVTGGLRSSSDPLRDLDPDELDALRRHLAGRNGGQQPKRLTRRPGALTHFTGWTFNLGDRTVDGVPRHGAHAAGEPAESDVPSRATVA